MKLTSKDIIGSIVTGLTAGFAGWQILDYLNAPKLFAVSWFWLVILVPLLWLAGIKLGYLLSRRWPFFAQFGKFAAIGFTNAAVDFGIFNLLFAISGQRHEYFIISNVISFCIAALHSYLWNKYWAFESSTSDGGLVEFAKFISILLIAVGVNTAVAYIAFVSGVGLGGRVDVWANLGKIAGSAVALLITFIGFRLIVFKRKES